MSVRPSLFVCAAVLAALLAPPAAAKPAAATREIAHAPGESAAARGTTNAATPGRTAKRPARPAGQAPSADAAKSAGTRPDATPGPGRSDMSHEVTPARKSRSKSTGTSKHVRKASIEDTGVAAAAPTASGCGAALGAAPALQFDRTRAILREFSWADMAHFFDTAHDEAEPGPTEVANANTLATDEAIRRSGLSRKSLEGLARARAVDLLTERELVRVDKALAGASPAAIATLLHADAPTLRAHVWTWLATTPAGVCALARLDGSLIDAAIRDRSVAVEHGDDLVFRPLGDYALAARTRLAAADPQAFDGLLRALWAEPGLDPRVRALVAGLRVRRGHADSIEAGLRDPTPAVRGATAIAAIDRDRQRYELRALDHAADDPADLVTELIVGELLGGANGVPQGLLASNRDNRVMTTVNRWRGRGDPLSPLPAPAQPLRFQKALESASPVTPAPVIAATPIAEPEVVPAPIHEEAPARPLAQAPARREAEASTGPSLPSVLDDPGGSALRP